MNRIHIFKKTKGSLKYIFFKENIYIFVIFFLYSHNNAYYNEVEEAPEDVLMELIARFGQTIMRARDDVEK